MSLLFNLDLTKCVVACVFAVAVSSAQAQSTITIGETSVPSAGDGAPSGDAGPPVAGDCGSANSVTVNTAPTANLCASGSALGETAGGPRAWICARSKGGTRASCSAPLAQQSGNGVCGSANGPGFTSAPTANLCSTGTASAVAGTGPWTCAGANAGASASCEAFAPTTAENPGPSAQLFDNPFYSCVRSFYVATNGNDSNPGTQAQPWATIQKADTSARTGGDCINVAPGTYEAEILLQHGGTGPNVTGYVAYRCETIDACHVLASRAGHVWGIEYPANFVVIDGFEIDGNNALRSNGIADACIGSDDPTYGRGSRYPKNPFVAGNSAHHIWILNNIVHHCNLSGISLSNKEWYYVIHNTAYHNSFESGYQGSGISLVVPQCIESGKANCYTSGNGSGYVVTGNDVAAFNSAAGTYAPYHIVVAWNSAYNNRINYDNPVGCGGHTDGNGIIMDTFYDDATKTYAYPFRSLVMNNTSYYNGGRGIHVFNSPNVTVINNTVFDNGTDTCMHGSVIGDLSQQGGANDAWINNISLSVQNARGNVCPLVAGNANGVADLNDTYKHNVMSGGISIVSNCLYNNDVTYFSCSNNACGSNPPFVNATAGIAAGGNGRPSAGLWVPGKSNFGLAAGSPAIDYGVSESFLPATDVDAGACSSKLTSACPVPDANY
jgi:parallel beta-helix repeat protein